MGLTEAYSLFFIAMMCKSSVQTSKTPNESTYDPGLAHMIIRNTVVYLGTKTHIAFVEWRNLFQYSPFSVVWQHTTSHTTAFATEFCQ